MPTFSQLLSDDVENPDWVFYNIKIMEKLHVSDVVRNAMKKGMVNLVPLLANVFLWLVTIWIPYFNIGTTIGLFVGVIAKMARGKPVSPTEVFNPDYRKYMGAFFLVSGLKMMGTQFAYLLFIVPGIVLSIAWSLAALLVVDKGENPMVALQKSNEVTYGNKMAIFLAKAAVAVIAMILLYLAGQIGQHLGFIGSLLTLVVVGAVVASFLAVDAYVYATLIGVDEELGNGPEPATE
jgi:hypothetical protein